MINKLTKKYVLLLLCILFYSHHSREMRPFCAWGHETERRRDRRSATSQGQDDNVLLLLCVVGMLLLLRFGNLWFLIVRWFIVGAAEAVVLHRRNSHDAVVAVLRRVGRVALGLVDRGLLGLLTRA